MKFEFSRQIFEKSSNIKFHENLSSGSGVVQCGRTRTDIMKLMITFHNFAKSPNKLILTGESVDFILYYSDFGLVLSLYGSHLLTCIHRYVI
jgi:hypothetical protein